MSSEQQPKRERVEALWEELAHGELSSEEQGFLKALAEADPELAEHAAAYAPINDESIERIAEAAQKSLWRHRARKRNLWWGSAAGALAVAAAVLLMVRPRAEDALPAYSLRLSQGLTMERGAAQAVAVPSFDAHSELDIIALPATRVSAPVSARAFLVRGAEIIAIPAQFSLEPSGALRFRGKAQDVLRAGPGRFELAIAIARKLPDDDELKRWVRARDARHVLFHVLEYQGPEARLSGAAGEVFAHVEALEQTGEFDAAERVLAPLLTDASAEVRTRAYEKRARLSATRGDLARAIEQIAAAIEVARAAGFQKRALDESLVRAYWLRRQFRFAEAEAQLVQIESHFSALPEVFGLVAYQRGLYARDRGDVRGTLTQLDLALSKHVSEPGRRSYEPSALQIKASALHAVGRVSEARELMKQASALVGDEPCARADYLTDAGWLSLLAAEREEGASDRAALSEAYRLYTEQCANASNAASNAQNAAVNLALAAMLEGDSKSAQVWLARAGEHVAEDPVVASWRIDIEGRLALARGDHARARALFGELEARTGVAGEAADRWRAALGVARAERAAHARDAARAAYRRAEAALEEETLSIPFHAGRETFAGTRDASARELAALELESGDTRAAYHVLRRARTRALRTLSLHDRLSRLDAQQKARVTQALEQHFRARAALEVSQAAAFTAATDELAALERTAALERNNARAALDRALSVLGPDDGQGVLPGAQPHELVLSFFPLADHWVGFAETEQQVRSAALKDPTRVAPEQVLELLLAPFARELSATARVRFLPYGALRELDLHALPYHGAPLIERVPVVYGADLGAVSHARSTAVVVVSDPRGNLSKARDEGRAVAERLSHGGSKVSVLEGRAATRAAVQKAILAADLLHVAAHAEGPSTHDRLGAILLADDERWEVDDVLALASVPREVVLSTCEGALEPAEAKVPGLGLAQAFLVRGADEVIASTRRVPDAFAQEFALALYESGEPADLATRFQHAVHSLREREPDAQHWKSYRTWVR
jgi:tetratricopeptide (TPR) repeat protein